jgi:hypothetical protein
LPAEHPEIMSRIESCDFCDFCASHKRDKNCVHFGSGIAEHAEQQKWFCLQNMQNHEHNNQKHVISVQATNERQDCALAWVFAEHAGHQKLFCLCRRCRNREQNHSFCASHKKDKAKLVQNHVGHKKDKACAQNHVGHKKDKPAQSVGHMLELVNKGY